MTKTTAIIVAAGNGNRFGTEIPKQYQYLNDKMILTHAINSLIACQKITDCVVVINTDHQDLYQKAIEKTDKTQLLPFIKGGATRQESVRLGLTAIAPLKPDFVLIHDAARPFVPLALLDDILENLKENQGVTPALPVNDSLHKVENGYALHALNRSQYMRMQTPQAFPFADILKAHLQFQSETVTDDVALAEKIGLSVKIIQGHEKTEKITTQQDLLTMKAPEKQYVFPDIRTGQGFDVHRFCNGDHLWLGGVKVPFKQGLSGHSDADVALHALTDAILGTIAAGDIGVHFPPSDPQWKGVDSVVFLNHALHLLHSKGGKILHCDLTIIGEYPKITPHRQAIQNRLAALLNLPCEKVSVKATTTERLGFLGRGEGLATQAIVTAGFL